MGETLAVVGVAGFTGGGLVARSASGFACGAGVRGTRSFSGGQWAAVGAGAVRPWAWAVMAAEG